MAENEGENDFDFPIKEEFTNTKEETTEETKEEEVVEEVVDEAPKDETSALEEKEVEAKETTEEVVEDKVEEVVDETTEQETTEEVVEERSLTVDRVSELTEGQFETTEDLLEAYNSLNNFDSSKSVMDLLNEQVVEEWGEDTTFQDLVAYKSVNYDEMDSLELLKQHEELKDPDVTETEIRAELRRFDLLSKSKEAIEEMIEEGELDRSTYEDLEASLVRKTRQARTALQEFQDSININDFNIQSAPTVQETEPAMSEDELKSLSDRYENSINSMEDIKINVGTEKEPLNLDYTVSDDDRNGIRDYLTPDEGKNFVQKHWVGEDGILDMDKLSKDIYKIQNHDRNVSIAYSQGKSAGSEAEVKEISNIDFNGGKTAPLKEGGLSEASRMAKEL